MSSKRILRMGAMAASGLAMMGLTACATGHAETRYGGYDYESGQNCGASCMAPAPVYAPLPPPVVTSMPVAPGPIYVDCTQIGSCAAPAPVYAPPTTTYSGEIANCPVGTMMQPDGTCMQSGSTSYSSHTTSTHIAPTTVNCPVGTMMQADGTCMQGSVDVYTPPMTGSYGYRSSGVPTDYRPIRK